MTAPRLSVLLVVTALAVTVSAESLWDQLRARSELVALYSKDEKVSDISQYEQSLLNKDSQDGVGKIKLGAETNLLQVIKDSTIEKRAQMQMLVRLLISYADSDVFIKNYDDKTYMENINLAVRIMLNHAWSLLGVLNDSAEDVYSESNQRKLKNATERFEEINKEALETTMAFDDQVTVEDIGHLWKRLEVRLLAWNREFLSYNIHPDKVDLLDRPERNLIIFMYEIINDDVTKMMLVQRIKMFNNYISEIAALHDEFANSDKLLTVLENGMIQLKNVAKVNLNSVEIFHPKAKQTHWYNDSMRHIKKTAKSAADAFNKNLTNSKEELIKIFKDTITFSHGKCNDALANYSQ